MRKRTFSVLIRLNEKEYMKVNCLVERSGLSREAYIRQLINGLVPTELPPPDYFAMMKELRKIGVNINQIAHKTNLAGAVDAMYYKEEAEKLNEAIVKITEAVMLPRKL